jgi:hypothetical protein
MSFSFSEQDLEALQRTAGLLGCSVDQLIALGSLASLESGATMPDVNLGDFTTEQGHISPVETPQHGDMPDGLTGRRYPIHQQLSDQTVLASAEFYQSFESRQDEISGGQHIEPVQEQDTEVILLNGPTVWYECNMDYVDQVIDFADMELDFHGAPTIPDQVQSSGGTDDSSYVHVTPLSSGSDGGSVSTVREDAENGSRQSGLEWSLVPSSSGSISAGRLSSSPSPSSRKRRYHLIAPKAGSSRAREPSESSLSPPTKIRKKRSRYALSNKLDTNMTRQMNACVRCRMQRNRVCTIHCPRLRHI